MRGRHGGGERGGLARGRHGAWGRGKRERVRVSNAICATNEHRIHDPDTDVKFTDLNAKASGKSSITTHASKMEKRKRKFNLRIVNDI